MKDDPLKNAPTRFHPGFRAHFGVARRDITPGVGIYNRAWGAALTDFAEGIHRPLTITALVILPHSEAEAPLAILSVDLGSYRAGPHPHLFEDAIRASGLDPKRCMVAFSHTHAGAALSPDRFNQPGGEHVRAFRELVSIQTRNALGEALATARPGWLETATGHCTLASKRDFSDPQSGRILTGWNPALKADTTLLVGRVCLEDGTPLATLINYACHPTILAWENRHLSPDYVGAMRELVERETNTRCLFLQGASGELAPRHQYTGDHAVADRAGYALGHAVLSTLFGMFPPGQGLRFEGLKESGAPLALWRPVARMRWDDTFSIKEEVLPVPLRKGLRSIAELEAALAQTTDRVVAEQLKRELGNRKSVGDGDAFISHHHFWRLGEVRFISLPNEIYSGFQQGVREAAGDACGLFVITVCGTTHGYLSPQAVYAVNGYTVSRTPFEEGCYELTLATFRDRLTADQAQATPHSSPP